MSSPVAAPRSRAKTSELSGFLRSSAPPLLTTVYKGQETPTPVKRRRLPFLGKKKPQVPLVPSESSPALTDKPSCMSGLLIGTKTETYSAPFFTKYIVPSPKGAMLPHPVSSSAISQPYTIASSQSSKFPPMTLSPIAFSPLLRPNLSSSPKRSIFHGPFDCPLPQSSAPQASEEGRHGFDLHIRTNSIGHFLPLPHDLAPSSLRNRNEGARADLPHTSPKTPINKCSARLPLLSRREGATQGSRPAKPPSTTSSACSTVPNTELGTPILSTRDNSYTFHASSTTSSPSPPLTPYRMKKHSVSIMRELEHALGTDVGFDSESNAEEEWNNGAGDSAGAEFGLDLLSSTSSGLRPRRLQRNSRPSPWFITTGGTPVPVLSSPPPRSANQSTQVLPTLPSGASTFASAQHRRASPSSSGTSFPFSSSISSASLPLLPFHPPPPIPLPPTPAARPMSVIPVGTASAAVLLSRSRSSTTTATSSRHTNGPLPPLPDWPTTPHRARRSYTRDRSCTTTTIGEASKDSDSRIPGALEAQRARCDRLVGRLAQLSAQHSEERASLVRQVERLEREAKKREREVKGLRWLVINNAGSIAAGAHPDTSSDLQVASSASVEDMQWVLRASLSGLGLDLTARANAGDARAVLAGFSSRLPPTTGSESFPSPSSTSRTAASALSSIVEYLPTPADAKIPVKAADASRHDKGSRHASWALHRLSVAPDPFTVPPYTPSPPLDDSAGVGRNWLAQVPPKYTAVLKRGRERAIAHERRATADMEIVLERLEKTEGAK